MAEQLQLSKGLFYRSPSKPDHDHIRAMPGDLGSPYANSRVPYVRRGSYVDKYGNKVDSDAAEGHIPWDEYTDFTF